MHETALIVGAGRGLSASLARLFASENMRVALASRAPEKLADLARETGALTFACDASKPDQVTRLFGDLEDSIGAPTVVVYNPSYRVRGPLTELSPQDVDQTLMITAFGGFLVSQQAAKRMLAAGRGTILLTGASASVKGYPQSAAFAMGKFALRGLAQSMARELAPSNIHTAHVIIDGAIRSNSRREANESPDSMLDPDAIAQTYLSLVRQHRSVWTWEIEVRPWVERF